jgi:ubiquinone/menaquinone biosynthesis C-methylase UbiE
MRRYQKNNMTPDFTRIAEDYGRYRPNYPAALFEKLDRLAIGRPGQRLLDLGAGTGALAREFAHRGCRVTGLDPCRAMLDKARQLDLAAAVNVRYVVASAEQNGLPDKSFDVVTAGSCWSYFERGRAGQEARRLLVPGGALVLIRFFRLRLPESVSAATNRLIEALNPAHSFTAESGLKPEWLSDLDQARFDRIESFSFDVVIPYSHDAWCARIRAAPSVGATLEPEVIPEFMKALRILLVREFPEQPLQVGHRIFAAIGYRPPAISTTLAQ